MDKCFKLLLMSCWKATHVRTAQKLSHAFSYCWSIAGYIYCWSIEGHIYCWSIAGHIYCWSIAGHIYCWSIVGHIYCWSIAGHIYCWWWFNQCVSNLRKTFEILLHFLVLRFSKLARVQHKNEIKSKNWNLTF